MVVRLQATVGVPRFERGIKVVDGSPYMYVEPGMKVEAEHLWVNVQEPAADEPWFFVPEGWEYYFDTEKEEIRLKKD